MPALVLDTETWLTVIALSGITALLVILYMLLQ